MKTPLFLTLSGFLILLSGICFSQKPPAKFGEPVLEELQMKSYPTDTTASAAILCRYGYFRSSDFHFEQFVRIKIFKKDGYEWANKHFTAHSDIYTEGYTYNLENGVIIKTKLGKKDIILEKLKSGKQTVSFAMPEVKEGSVIDIQLTSTSFPDEWKFQELIPVRWSELKIEASELFNYQFLLIGKLPLFINLKGHWLARDMVAFHEEPYMNSVENYISELQLDITDFTSNSTFASYAASWNSVCTYLLRSHYFGGALNDDGYLRDLSRQIKASGKSPEQQIRMACERIKQLKWDKTNSIYTDWDTQGIMMSKGTGNSAELNLALCQLIKRLGFPVQPVVISTRDNGMLSAIQPTLNKLNDVIVCVWLDKKPLLLDATEPLLSYRLLPTRCLNHLGRSVCDTTAWVYITAAGKDKQSTYYDLTLGDDFNLQGKMNTTRTDYSAYLFRKNFKSFNSKEEFLTNYLSDKPSVAVLNSRFENIDSLELPMKLEYELSINNQQNVMNDEVYIQPLFMNKYDENPFKEETRKYPMDFSYPVERTVTVVIKIPAGMTVTSVPDPLSLRLEDNSLFFQYQVTALDNMVQVSLKYTNNKTMVEPEDYLTVQHFYSQLIKKQSEMIILKKK